jgi:O-antigen ligase
LACSRPLSNWLNLDTEIDLSTISSQISEGSFIDRALCTALIVLGVMVLLNRRQALIRNAGYCWPILLFLAYCIISLSWSDFPSVALKRLIRESGNLIMIAVIWTEAHPLTALKTLFARTAYTLIPLSILFCKYYPFGREYGRWTGEAAYTGVTDDKNALGALCLICGVTSLWYLLTWFGDRRHNPSRPRHVIVQSVTLVMAIYLLAKADSVTAASCAVLAAAVLFALRLRIVTGTRSMVHLVMLAAIAIPACIALLGAKPEILQAMGRDSTLTDRTLIWSWVTKLVPNQWVGAGYGSFWLGQRLDVMVANVTHTWVPNQAHNGYLEIFANLGWIGVALLGIVVAWGYGKVIRGWRRKTAASDLMIAYFVIGVISNISEASFFRNAVPVWLFFMIGVTMPPVEEERSREEVIQSNRSAYPMAAPAVESAWELPEEIGSSRPELCRHLG